MNNESILGLSKDSYDNIYAATFPGAYRSTDNGQTWQSISTSLSVISEDIEIDSNNYLFLASTSGIYKSTNLGNSWQQVKSGLFFDLYIDEYNFIYACSFRDFCYSSNGGNTWQNIYSVTGDIYDVFAINNIVYAGTRNGLQKSTNLGSSWSLCFKYSDRFVKTNGVMILHDNHILLTSSEGLFISQNNGISWDSLLTTNSKLIKKDRSGNIYINSDYFYRSSDQGLSWIKCKPTVSNFFINDSNSVYATNGSRDVFISTDQGVSWDTITHFDTPYWGNIFGISQNHYGSIFISKYFREVLPGGYIYIEKHLLRTNNNGLDWTRVRDDLYISNIYFIDSSMYLTTFDSGIYKSYNNGINVSAINNGLFNKQIKDLLILPNKVLICATADGIYRSLDDGEYWYRLNPSGLLSTSINSLFFDESRKLYACTDNGIGIFTGELPVEFSLLDASLNGKNVLLQWATITETNNRGFEIERKTENTQWRTIGFREGNGTTTEPQEYGFVDDLFEVNATKLSYRLKQIDFNGTFMYSNIIEVELAPYKFSLFQNYPNPFNPSTKIKYTISSPQYATLKVYDLLGNEVTTLVNEYKPAGSYEIEFQSSVGSKQLASGIYLYQLKAGEFVETKKMILLR